MSERIQVTKKDGVADVKLVRTDKMNALDDAMFEALLSTTEELSKDKSVRCVVLSGDGGELAVIYLGGWQLAGQQ